VPYYSYLPNSTKNSYLLRNYESTLSPKRSLDNIRRAYMVHHWPGLNSRRDIMASGRQTYRALPALGNRDYRRDNYRSFRIFAISQKEYFENLRAVFPQRSGLRFRLPKLAKLFDYISNDDYGVSPTAFPTAAYLSFSDIYGDRDRIADRRYSLRLVLFQAVEYRDY
jgi:hypothetical protein